MRDTIIIEKVGSVITNPQLINSIPYPVDKLTSEIKYLPDTNYYKLVIQYKELLEAFLAMNVQKDSIRLDSLGYVNITDTVSKNLIQGRKIDYKLSYPEITTTVTLPYKPRNQLYIGGGIQGNPNQMINQFNVGLLWKNKKDQIFGGYVGTDMNTTLQYGIQSYWKINLRKK